MGRFLLNRFITIIILMFLLTAIIFVFVSASPEGLSRVFPVHGSGPFELARSRSWQELDQSSAQQYFAWLGEILRGNFGGVGGWSRDAGSPLAPIIWSAFRVSLTLIIPALIFAVSAGLFIGVYSALKPRSFITRIFNSFAILGASIPDFALGVLLLMLFAVTLGWLPVSGYRNFGLNFTEWSAFWDGIKPIILPALTLSVGFIASFSEHVKTSVDLVMQEDYIRTARAKGLKERVVIFKHALRNSLIPILATIFSSLPFFFGGIVIVERLFSWPGLGSFIYDKIVGRPALGGDFYAVLIVVGMVSFFSLLGSLIADFLYALVDPRVRNPVEKRTNGPGLKELLIFLGMGVGAVAFYHWALVPLYGNIQGGYPIFWSMAIIFTCIGFYLSWKTKPKTEKTKKTKINFTIEKPSLKVNWRMIGNFLRRCLKPGILIGVVILFAIIIGHFYFLGMGYEEIEDIPMDIRNREESPSLEHWFGTDFMGRSIFTKVLVVAGETLKIVFYITLIGTIGGALLGSLVGFLGGPLDRGLMAVFDLISSIPSFFFVFLIMGVMAGEGDSHIIMATAVFGLMELARIVRAQMLSMKEFQFVEAAKALGNSPFQVLTRHLFRNVFPLVWGQGIILFARNMVLISSLGYLQIIQRETWGYLVGEDVRSLTSLASILMIILVVFAVNVIGKGVFSSLDPLKRQT